MVKSLLVQDVANVNVKDNTRQTPLLYAAKGGYVQMVALLLGKNGIYANVRDCRGLALLSRHSDQKS